MVLETGHTPNRRSAEPALGQSRPIPRLPTEDELSAVVGFDDPTEFFEAVLGLVELLSGNGEFVIGREEFFWKTGKVFVDDPFYEERTNYFLTHFFFARPLSSDPKVDMSYQMLTPLEGLRLLCDKYATTEVTTLASRLAELEHYEHGIYQILKGGDTVITVRNLITDTKTSLSARPGTSFVGLRAKEIFQGFVAPYQGTLFLFPGIIIHPGTSTRTVKRYLKSARKRESFDLGSVLYRLASVQLKHCRHKHVTPKKIYDAELILPKG